MTGSWWTRPRARLSLAALALLGALGAAQPAAAATRIVQIPLPAAGNATVAHLEFKVTKRGKPARRAAIRVTNATGLPRSATLVGGVALKRGRAYVGSLVLANRTSAATAPDRTRARGFAGMRARGSAATFARVELRLPSRSAPFAGKPRVLLGRNVATFKTRPPYCRKLPRSWRHVAPKPLLGAGVPGFAPARATRFAYLLACKLFPERDRFLAALKPAASGPEGDEEGSGEGRGGETGDEDGGENPDEEGGEDSAPTEPRVIGGGSGSLSWVAGFPERVRFTVRFDGPTYFVSIVFPRSSGTLVEGSPGCAMREADPELEGEEGSETPAQAIVSCSTEDSGGTYAAGQDLTGVIALSPMPSAGMGATATAAGSNRQRYRAVLTGP